MRMCCTCCVLVKAVAFYFPFILLITFVMYENYKRSAFKLKSSILKVCVNFWRQNKCRKGFCLHAHFTDWRRLPPLFITSPVCRNDRLTGWQVAIQRREFALHNNKATHSGSSTFLSLTNCSSTHTLTHTRTHTNTRLPAPSVSAWNRNLSAIDSVTTWIGCTRYCHLPLTIYMYIYIFSRYGFFYSYFLWFLQISFRASWFLKRKIVCAIIYSATLSRNSFAMYRYSNI